MAEEKEKSKYGSGYIRQRKDGSWEGLYYAGVNEETGKKKRKSVFAKTRLEEA